VEQHTGTVCTRVHNTIGTKWNILRNFSHGWPKFIPWSIHMLNKVVLEHDFLHIIRVNNQLDALFNVFIW